MIRSISIIAGLGLCLAACSAAPMRPVVGEQLPACGTFPNCVNSESGEGVHAVAPLRATAAQWSYLTQWLSSQEDWRVVVADELFVQAVITTPLMRYTDDVQLSYQPEVQLIQVRSSSRFGIGDMGANLGRVEALRAEILSHFDD